MVFADFFEETWKQQRIGRLLALSLLELLLGLEGLHSVGAVLLLDLHDVVDVHKCPILLDFHHFPGVYVDNDRALGGENRSFVGHVEAANLLHVGVEQAFKHTNHSRKWRIKVVYEHRRQTSDEEAVPLHLSLTQNQVSEAEHHF